MQKILDEENKEIGFDLSLLKRDELPVNLIHFDLNITNKENYKYYNKFKIDVVGGYIGIDSIYMFKNYLEALKDKNIPFIVLSSGFSGKEIIPICVQYPFIKEVIIFCGNYNKYKHYLTQYPGYVKKIFVNIIDVYNYIKTFGSTYAQGTNEFKKTDHFIFSPEDIQSNKQLEQCPVISAYEYDNCYFLVHKAYAHFFRNDNKNIIFTKNYFNKIQDFINKTDLLDINYKKQLNKQFVSFVDKDNFVELSIRQHTAENIFHYFLNRTMRNFDKGLISLAYFNGPFLYGLNKYIKDYPYLGFNQNMTLYKNIECSEFDYYLYKMNLNHIICFPSFTSTCLNKIQFFPSKQSKHINNYEGKSKILYLIKMIFNYTHEAGNISPGILILNNKGKDNQYLSKFPQEKEVLLFPFTFVRIIGIKEIPQEENQIEIYFDIINRKQYIEYTLRDNVQNRFKFNDLD